MKASPNFDRIYQLLELALSYHQGEPIILRETELKPSYKTDRYCLSMRISKNAVPNEEHARKIYENFIVYSSNQAKDLAEKIGRHLLSS